MLNYKYTPYFIQLTNYIMVLEIFISLRYCVFHKHDNKAELSERVEKLKKLKNNI